MKGDNMIRTIQEGMRTRREKRRERPREEGKKALADFSEEYVEKRVLIDVERLGTLEGRLLKATRYWFKLLTENGVIYLNKAFVIAITPMNEEEKKSTS
jgi:hypothetical protein